MTDRIVFACDYEGTYHKRGGHPDDRDVEAVRRFRKEGNLFGIVLERDVFEALANMGEYDEEYDFLICSGGAGVVVRLPVDPMEYNPPIRVLTDTANQYFLCELYDLFRSVGAERMASDVFGFMGGDCEGERFSKEYVCRDGMSCWVHYWGGAGDYRVYPVNRDALAFVTPFSQCRATFKNAVSAEGVAAEVNRRYNGWLHAYAKGMDVVVHPAGVTKATGVAKLIDFIGASFENVWTFGDGAEDVDMIKNYKGIALTGAHPSVLEATSITAGGVEEAIDIICGK